MLFPTFAKIQNIIQIVIIGNRSTILSKHYFLEHLKIKWLLLQKYFGLSTLTLITRLVHFMLMNLYEKSKTSKMVTVIFWHQKYSLSCTKVLGFVACIVTSNVIVIGAAERSWGDVKTIRSGKRYAISSDVSEKQSNVYTSVCI